METSLSDNMVKLVRYSVVSIKRDEEKPLVVGKEKLFDDNLDGEAFTTWVTSEVAGAHGVPDEDRKYLRVSYEVLGRWPKQDRKYEKRKLEKLDGILHAVEQVQLGNPFDRLGRRMDRQAGRLKTLRADLARCADGVAEGLYETLEQHRDQGEFEAVRITRARLAKALKEGAGAKFNTDGLEAFVGRYRGINRRYLFASGEEVEADAAEWFMTWEQGETKDDGEYVQRVVGSQRRHYASDELPDLSENLVDLALNLYRKDLGITGWLTTRVEARQELALIAYQFDKLKFLWVGQVLSPNLEPVLDKDVFWMFLEWLDPKEESPAYFMYGLMFEIDFDAGTAKPFGDSFRKARFDSVG